MKKYGLLTRTIHGVTFYSIISTKTRDNTNWRKEITFEEVRSIDNSSIIYESMEVFKNTFPHITMLCEFDTLEELKNEYPEYFI